LDWSLAGFLDVLVRNARIREKGIPARSLHKGPFVQRKGKSPVYAGWHVAKSCCFIEIIGDTFAQC
jgi:hypothetical protein